jgi:hypothetical protein
LDRAIELVKQQGTRANVKGCDVFAPSLGARLVHAFVRDVHHAPRHKVARAQAFCSHFWSLLLDDEGKRLRKLTAQELARFAVASSYTPGSLDLATEALHHVEAECLRRGLDKFKAADLADLTGAFRRVRHRVARELAEAIEERIMRRGYLTRGRVGERGPGDIVRLLEGLLYVHGDYPLQPVIFDRFLEAMMREGFVEGLDPHDMAYAITITGRLRGLDGRVSEPKADLVLSQLVSRVEEWRGPQENAPRSIEAWFKSLARLTDGSNATDVVAISRRLTEAWAAAVEGGHHDISDPHPFFVQMEICYRVRILGVEGTEHIAKVLNEELARLLRADGGSCVDSSNSRILLKVLQLWRGAGYYPGHALMDTLVDHMLTMGDVGQSVLTELLVAVVHHAERVHGYKPKAGFADRMLEILSSAPLEDVHDLRQMCASIEMLCTSASVRRAQQPVVQGFIGHIGDPEALVERLCGGSNPGLLQKLNRALDLLETVASGGDVAK